MDLNSSLNTRIRTHKKAGEVFLLTSKDYIIQTRKNRYLEIEHKTFIASTYTRYVLEKKNQPAPVFERDFINFLAGVRGIISENLFAESDNNSNNKNS